MKSRMTASLAATFLVQVLEGSGCAPDEPDDTQLTQLPLQKAAPDVVVKHGKKFVRLSPSGRQPRHVGHGLFGESLAAPTESQANEGIRPLVVVSAHPDVTYIGEGDPDIQQKIRAGQMRGSRRRPANPGPAVQSSAVRGVDPVDPGGGGSCSGVFGTDSRVTASRRRSAPYAQQIWMKLDDGSSCSGTMIGPTTMFTAAHCLWDPNTNNWTLPVEFVPGADDSSPVDPRPFGSSTCWSWIAVPGGYPDGSDFYDWGVVTFETCGANQPGAKVGHLGWWIEAPPGPTVEMWGYPGSFANQTGFPQLAGTVGNAMWSDGGWAGEQAWYTSSSLDGSIGQSGAAWFIWDGFYVVAEYSEIACGWFNRWNQARRITTRVESFIDSVSSDW